MLNTPKIDPTLFLIMNLLDRYGHEQLPFKIIKENQSYIIGHEREMPMVDKSGVDRKIFEHACKVTFVKTTGEWKLFWMRATYKWNLYGVYDNLESAMKEVRRDKDGCFWG